MMCGLCVEACPFDAIEMSHDYELARIDPDARRRPARPTLPAAGPSGRAEQRRQAGGAAGRAGVRAGAAAAPRRGDRCLSTVNGVAFAVLALAIVGGAVGDARRRNVVHAAFWLLEVVGRRGRALLPARGRLRRAACSCSSTPARSPCSCSSSIMLTLRRREDAVRPRDFSLVAALASRVAFAAVVIGRGRSACACRRRRIARARPGHRRLRRGAVLADGGSLPFEIASLVLLVALVGAVWWSREGDELMRVGRRRRSSSSPPCSSRSGCTARSRRRARSWCSCRSSSCDRRQHQPRRVLALRDARDDDGPVLRRLRDGRLRRRDRTRPRARARDLPARRARVELTGLDELKG